MWSESMVSSAIESLEEVVGEDVGSRGVGHLRLRGQLAAALTALHGQSRVCILTGFPCLIKFPNPAETDGPPGAVAMARALVNLGKQVVILADKYHFDILAQCLKACGIADKVKLVMWLQGYSQSLSQDNSSNTLLHDNKGQNKDEVEDEFVSSFLYNGGDPTKPNFDHLISIELSGPAEDGKFYSMRAIDLTKYCPHYDKLFLLAKKHGNITFTGIGDGGNEMGMGKVVELVRKHINNGQKIACVIAADNLIVAGVSNWGGYAIACGLYLMHLEGCRKSLQGKSNEHKQAPTPLVDKALILPQENLEKLVLQAAVDMGAHDGITGSSELFVDGISFEEHMKLLKKLHAIVLKAEQ